MITLRSDSRLVRFAHFLDRLEVDEHRREHGGKYLWFMLKRADCPSKTSLCQLFWRTVFAPVACLVILTIIGGFMLVRNAVEWSCGNAWRRRRERRYKSYAQRLAESMQENPTPSGARALWMGLLVIKAKMCPLIRIVDYYRATVGADARHLFFAATDYLDVWCLLRDRGESLIHVELVSKETCAGRDVETLS